MAWMLYALAAAALWGTVYFIYELLLKSVSAATILFFSYVGTGVLFAAWAFASGTVIPDWQILKKWGWEMKLLIVITVLSVLANLTFLASMKLKNATVSGLIEITYPLFTALLAWFFLREVQMGWGTFAGALLIMAGIACIFYFERA